MDRGAGERGGAAGGSGEPRGERRAARLEEIPLADAAEAKPGDPEATGPPASPSSAGRRLDARLRAGLRVDLGLVPPEVLRHWQERVVAADFDADACAREILAAPRSKDSDAHLEARSRTLLRDFVMAPRQRGRAAAGRAVRGAARTGAAMFLTHLFTLAVYTLLVAVGLLLLRARGVEIDRLLDNLLAWVPSARRG